MVFKEDEFLYAVIFAGELNGYDAVSGDKLSPMETVVRLTSRDGNLMFNSIEVGSVERKYQINTTQH